MGGRRWAVMGLVALLLASGLGFIALLARSQDSVGTAQGSSGSFPGSEEAGPASSVWPQEASLAPEVSASLDSRSPNAAGAAASGARSPNAPRRSPSGGPPPSPPPQPPPSPPSRPTPIPCKVSVYNGPIPGAPNIRVVVTTDPNVDMVWATVSDGDRSLRGAIALAGGRGEQIVDGMSQRAHVIVFADASMAEPVKSCSNIAD